MAANSTGSNHATLSKSEQEEVREQLSRLLDNPFFSHSKRFPTFLRFVVEQTLAGEVDSIKERTLGIEIFGRDADYDTASDPIVRVTAAEIRKRVAQYYQDPAHEKELRIDLLSGSYVPQFQLPRSGNEAGLPDADLTADEPLEQAALPHPRRWFRFPLLLAVIGVAAGLLSVGAILFWQQTHQSALNLFWGPILNGNEPVLLCIADQLEYSGIALRAAAAPP